MLSKNFSLKELTASSTASRKGINNTPSEEQVIALTALVNCVLQPVRDHYGKSVRVSSGFRSRALNAAVGGSRTSEHTLGQAADFTVSGVSCKEVCEWIANESGLEWNQLIFERRFDSTGKETTQWIHVSCSRHGDNKKQVLTAFVRPGKAEYVTGIVD